ncbi:unnamed protein product [Lactuca virosa]|uniref:Uncharacterized protein n=1 Tax=Lactuca virosa TaxID=75947 RepID=A0AAU9NEZ1_9ASTR|nr:unnamed protein product [Lactuca virosa]
MLESVIPDKEVYDIMHVPELPLRHPGCRSDVFSLEQMLGDSFSSSDIRHPLVVPSDVGVEPFTILPPTRNHKHTLTPHQFKNFLRDVSGAAISSPSADYHALVVVEVDKACRYLAQHEKIISITNVKEMKFFDGLLTLRDHYLSAEVNLRAADSMKLAGKEVLIKAGGMYAELVEQHIVMTERVIFFGMSKIIYGG